MTENKEDKELSYTEQLSAVASIFNVLLGDLPDNVMSRFTEGILYGMQLSASIYNHQTNIENAEEIAEKIKKERIH